ncbi:MAG: hypothetical protein L3J57_15700, partial [Desulfuromusa sp.]|nr:hypothetical protein [Desulfuromusa sp.]
LHRETYRETDLDSWIYLLVELLSITTMSDYVTSTFVWWIEPKYIVANRRGETEQTLRVPF